MELKLNIVPMQVKGNELLCQLSKLKAQDARNLRDKTLVDELIYILNNNHLFFRIKLLVKKFGHCHFEQINLNGVPIVFKPI